jgi:hypothetical protein
MQNYKPVFLFVCLISIMHFISGCDILGSSDSCRELQSEPLITQNLELFRYNTKITIEFINEWTHQQAEGYLEEFGFPFEEIWLRTFVVETGCGIPADHYYTNYGTDEVISLGDSSFVKYVNPVFFYRSPSGDSRLNSDFRLSGYVGVQFDRELEFERIQEIATTHNLQFREYDPGAPLGRYWLIVPKQACCNAIEMAEILIAYEEVLIAEPSFNFTVPPPDD